MAITYKEYVTTGSECVAMVKQGILSSSDWAHLQLTTGTQATTLASSASAGATSVSTAATVPSGSYITIGNGAANPEVRITTGVSGSGPYTLTFATALAGTYGSGAAVGVGSIVKATTTRGAQMVVDLAEAAITTTQMSLALYRTHNGTTGVDKVLRYHYTGISPLTNIARIKVSASKEHLYFETEGPRPGETGGSTAYGPVRGFSFLGDINPYFGGDAVPAVVAVMQDVTGTMTGGSKAVVSRNQGDTDSWVPASLLSLCHPFPLGYGSNSNFHNHWQQLAKGDGKVYIWPYVVVEDRDGLRGRINSMFFAGWTLNSNFNPQGWGIVPFVLSEGSFVSYGGTTYRVFSPVRAPDTGSWGSAALSGVYAQSTSDQCPLLALPYSTP